MGTAYQMIIACVSNQRGAFLRVYANPYRFILIGAQNK